MNETCRLCGENAIFFHQDTQRYFRCPICNAIFTCNDDLPDTASEKERYELHTTEIDEGYKKFVAPITCNVKNDFTSDAKGLDFGCGTSRIISRVLAEEGYDVANYDPYFCDDTKLLEQKYDFITSCEVIEHFYNPAKEFAKLRDMLTCNGKLYLMTDIYDDSIDFTSWYYKNDPTHVFLYTKETFEWIRQHFGFETLYIEKRLVVLQ